MTIDQVVDVIAMRDRFVSTSRPVNMIRRVPGADMSRRTGCRIGRIDRQGVFFHSAICVMVQVTIVQIVHMPLMLDCGVAAVRSMLVIVIGVVRHQSLMG